MRFSPRLPKSLLPRAAALLLPGLLLGFAEAPAREIPIFPGAETPVFRVGTKSDPLLAIRRDEEGGALTVEAKRGGVVIPIGPVSLEQPGSRVEVPFKAIFEGADAASRGFRIGLFDLPGEGLVTGDVPQVNAKIFSAAEGYLITSRLASRSVTESEIVRRNPEEPMLFSTAGGKILGMASEPMDVAPGAEYEGKFTIRRTGADEIAVALEIGGRQIAVATDSGGAMPTQFNLVGLFLSNARPSPDETLKVHFKELKVITKP